MNEKYQLAFLSEIKIKKYWEKWIVRVNILKKFKIFETIIYQCKCKLKWCIDSKIKNSVLSEILREILRERVRILFVKAQPIIRWNE